MQEASDLQLELDGVHVPEEREGGGRRGSIV